MGLSECNETSFYINSGTINTLQQQNEQNGDFKDFW